MPYYDGESVISVDGFRADADGFIRAPRIEVPEHIDIGQEVAIVRDDRMKFARVVRFEGGRLMGTVCLRLLKGRDATRAARNLAEAWDEWCDVVDDEY